MSLWSCLMPAYFTFDSKPYLYVYMWYLVRVRDKHSHSLNMMYQKFHLNGFAGCCLCCGFETPRYSPKRTEATCAWINTLWEQLLSFTWSDFTPKDTTLATATSASSFQKAEGHKVSHLWNSMKLSWSSAVHWQHLSRRSLQPSCNII